MKIKKMLAVALSSGLIMTCIPTNLNTYAADTQSVDMIVEKVARGSIADVAVTEIGSSTLAANATANTEQYPERWDNDGYAEWAFDDTAHWWHTRYEAWDQVGAHHSDDTLRQGELFRNGKYPWVGSGFGSSIILQKITYLGRTDKLFNWIGECKLYVANVPDGTTPQDKDFVEVAEGDFAIPDDTNKTTPREIVLDKPIAATHFRLEAHTKVGGGDDNITASRIRVYKYDTLAHVPAPQLTMDMPQIGQAPVSVSVGEDVHYAVSDVVWSQNDTTVDTNGTLAAGEATVDITLTANDGYVFADNVKPATMMVGEFAVPITTEVSTDGSTMTISYTHKVGSTLHNTGVAYATGCEAMGKVSVSTPVVAEGDSVTYTAVRSSVRYAFEGWYTNADASGDAVSKEAVYTIDSVEGGSALELYAKFEVTGALDESEYWDEELAAGTLGNQTEDDVWLYQVKGSNGLWVNFAANALNATAIVNGETGKWGDGSGGYDYTKLAKGQMTPFEAGVGYAWKASNAGYYSATLKQGIGACSTSKFQLKVSYVPSSTPKADGKQLLAKEIGAGENFESKIAKANAGDYLRIFSNVNGGTWVTGFYPVIVKHTAKEYAVQYVADVRTMLTNNPDLYSNADSINNAISDLNNLLDDSSTATDAEIEEKITALENAIKNADVTRSIKYTNPTVGGSLDISAGDQAFYDVANAFTVDFVYKFANGTSIAGGNSPRALFTISNGQGNYFTVWYNPKVNTNGTQGRICITNDSCTSGLFWSRTEAFGINNKWHKITVSISKTGKLDIILDGVNCGDTDGNFDLESRKASFNKYIVNHDWSVKEVLVGRKATNSNTNDGLNLIDVPSSDGLQVKYIEVSAKSYSSFSDCNGDTNSAKADQYITDELDTILTAEEEANLNENAYTSTTWSAYSSKLTAARNLVTETEAGSDVTATDWVVCNAMDDLKEAKAALQLKAEFTAASLTLNDNVGVNFSVKVNDTDNLGNLKVVLSSEGKTEETFALSELTPADASNNIYKVSYDMNAAEMTQDIVAKVMWNNGTDDVEVKTITYSVEEYAAALLASDESNSAKALIKAMLNYGAYSQKQFNVNTGALANRNLDGDDKPNMANIDATTIPADSVSVGSIDGVARVTNASLLLRSKTMLRIYFEMENGVTLNDCNIAVTCGGKTINPVVNSAVGYIQIEGIVASELDAAYTLTLTKDSKTMTVKYSPLNYVKTVLQTVTGTTDADVNLRNVVKALYLYNKAADEYFNPVSEAE